mgnify:CR=1 FL=1
MVIRDDFDLKSKIYITKRSEIYQLVSGTWLSKGRVNRGVCQPIEMADIYNSGSTNPSWMAKWTSLTGE